MKSVLGLLTGVLLLAGCATTAPPAADMGAFTGEVWTWDERTGIITLRQGGQYIRVKAAPDQFRGLDLHSTRTVYGVLAGPAEIQTVLTPPVPLMVSGTPDETDVTGRVTSIDPVGKIMIETPRGSVEVWVAQPTASVVQVGDRVLVKMRVQPMVPAPLGHAPAATTLEPAASPTSEPGEYAVVRGRLLEVDPSGRLTVESPRGPITVWVPAGSRYQPGKTVEVHTSVHPAR
ncbi:MAG: hypothetical protein AUH30_19020 [Candidatus Rokubacteria bacterium 13_1_40CM_68_15]|nr:MAG: hypothetical protein AUH30_19020 [Candidatus Rokubacteria bacterium 13_1_40CM_68_15]